MRLKIKDCLVSAVFYCMLLAGPVLAVRGADETKRQVLEVQTLTIRLGPVWAGTRFQLRMDVGPYPEMVDVGDDGILRIELNENKTYELVCMEDSAPLQESRETEAYTDTEQEAVRHAR